MGITMIVKRFHAVRMPLLPVVLSQTPARSVPLLPPFISAPSVLSPRCFHGSRSGVSLNRAASSFNHTYPGPDPKKWIELLISSFRKAWEVHGLDVQLFDELLAENESLKAQFTMVGEKISETIKPSMDSYEDLKKLFNPDIYASVVSNMVEKDAEVKEKDIAVVKDSSDVINIHTVNREKLIVDVMKVLLDLSLDIHGIKISVGKLKDDKVQVEEPILIGAGKDEKKVEVEVEEKLNKKVEIEEVEQAIIQDEGGNKLEAKKDEKSVGR